MTVKFMRLQWAGHVDGMGEMRNAYGVMVGESLGKHPLGRQRRHKDNIKMDPRKILRGWEVDGTSSGLCSMVGFGISGAESSGSAIIVLVS
jgi:hypothetical protein